MGKPLIVYCNVPAFKEWPTNFKLLFQALVTFGSALGFCHMTKSLYIRYIGSKQLFITKHSIHNSGNSDNIVYHFTIITQP